MTSRVNDSSSFPIRETHMTVVRRSSWAQDGQLTRTCLVEELRPEFAQNRAVALRYIEIARQLQHHPPYGVAPILDCRLEQSYTGRLRPLIAQKSPLPPRAQTLLRFQAGKLPLDVALYLADEVATTLQGLQKLGLFGGGLTSENLLLDFNGQIWIDGLPALICEREFSSTPPSQRPERVRWCAPEVLRDVGFPASDIYFLGAWLYWLLTGEAHPQEWEPRWSFLMAILHQAGIEGSQLSPLVKLFHRTLNERPEQRYASLSQFREALNQLGLEGARPRLRLELIERLADKEPTPPPTPKPPQSRPRQPDEDTRLLPQHHHALPAFLRDKIAPHPLEILARSRYAIAEELGVGGMGTVYRAKDQELGTTVAIKLLHQDLNQNPNTLARFRRELRLTRDLAHPNIIPAYHLECFEGLYLYSMKYVEGVTLRAHLRQHGPPPVFEAIEIMRDVADALACAHEHGIVHRDIKSTNIMLESRKDAEKPHVYLTDFGIATDNALSDLTRTGQQLGTPQYMAPEQALGKDPHAGADIYSFAVVFYELLTGHTPFSGETAVAVYTSQVKESYTPLLDALPQLPEALDHLLTQCLRANPDERPTSMRSILSTLDTLLESP